MSIDTLESEREESLAAQNEASAIPKLTTWFSVSNGRLVGVAMLFGALVLTSGGALWAVDSGVSAPLALMVGYCAATSTVALFAATRTVRPMHVEQPATAPQGPGTSEAWKLVNTLTVSDASRLWCDIEPGATATQETMAWGRALLDAIKRGELLILTKAGSSEVTIERERENPHYKTQVSRDALQAWASGHGYAPNFLR